MKIVLLDLDNTIANDGWRVPYIRWDEKDPFKRYHDYHCLSAFDEIGNKHILNIEGTMQIIVTARPKLYECVTREWLMRNGVKFAMLMMRPDKNLDDSVKLKQSFLNTLNCLYNIDTSNAMAYDDREPVIEMYKANGICSELISLHNNNSYAPQTKKGKR